MRSTNVMMKNNEFKHETSVQRNTNSSKTTRINWHIDAFIKIQNTKICLEYICVCE